MLSDLLNLLGETVYKLHVRFNEAFPSMLERMNFIVRKTLFLYLLSPKNVPEVNGTCSSSQCRNWKMLYVLYKLGRRTIPVPPGFPRFAHW